MKNLNRIKRVLSAKQGTEIPKFQNSGSIQDPHFIEFLRKSNLNLDPESVRIIYNNLKTSNPTDSTDQLIEKYKNTLNSSNNSRSLIEMEVPGAPALNPNSAIENAAQDNQTAAMLKREENTINALLVEPLSTPIQGVTVPKPISMNTDISQLQQKVQTKIKQEAESYGMNLQKQAAKKEKWTNIGMQAGQAVTGAVNAAVGYVLNAF